MTIKNLGNYTSKLTDLTTQTPIVLDGPYGTFTPLADNRRKVFVAGGIGITPFLSILSTWQELKQVPKTVLLWSVRTEAELIDAPLLKQMADRCTWFTFVPTVTNEQSSAYLHGRITPQLLTQTLVAGDPRTTDLYICGPTALIRLVQGSARSCGVQRQNIHFELFSF